MDSKIEDGQLQWMEKPKDQQCFSMKTIKRKVKLKKKEFIGWGSRPLIEFLASIGLDTSRQFSQYEVNSVITEYVNKNNLMHPAKKKKRVLCDEWLQSVFGRKVVSQNKIYALLESHFSENVKESEDEEFKSSSEDLEANASKGARQRMSSSQRSHQRKKVLEVPQSCFASVTPRNIKLVYLKRSLVEYFLKSPETFEEKVVGSFVRVKCDPNDYLQRNSHQLLQVTGIKEALGTIDISMEIFLKVSDVKKEIRIGMLSDHDFSEEECDDLHRRVKDGLIKKPTIVELEQKARILHEDITNHWIDREVTMLQSLIERANEKGWRRELVEFLGRKQLLQTPSERLQMLQEIPTITVEELPEATPQHSPLDRKEAKDDSPRVNLVGALGSSAVDLASNITTSTQMVVKTDAAGDGAVSDQKSNREVGGIDAAYVVSRQYGTEQNSVQGQQHHTFVAEQRHQSVEFDKQTREISCAAVKQQHQPTEVKERSRGKLISCFVKEQHGAIEVAVESNREMKEREVTEVKNQGIHLHEHKHDIEEERCIDIQLDCTAEQQHHLLQVNRNSRGLQQQADPVKVDNESSKESPIADVTEKEDQPMDVEHTVGATIVDLDENEGNCTMVKRQRVSAQVVELSDDDEAPGNDKCPGHSTRNQYLEDPDMSFWHYVDPFGDVQGPFPMSVLKQWSDSNYFGPDFKVWKMGQSEEEAILLTDVLSQIFPRN